MLTTGHPHKSTVLRTWHHLPLSLNQALFLNEEKNASEQVGDFVKQTLAANNMLLALISFKNTIKSQCLYRRI